MNVVEETRCTDANNNNNNNTSGNITSMTSIENIITPHTECTETDTYRQTDDSSTHAKTLRDLDINRQAVLAKPDRYPRYHGTKPERKNTLRKLMTCIRPLTSSRSNTSYCYENASPSNNINTTRKNKNNKNNNNKNNEKNNNDDNSNKKNNINSSNYDKKSTKHGKFTSPATVTQNVIPKRETICEPDGLKFQKKLTEAKIQTTNSDRECCGQILSSRAQDMRKNLNLDILNTGYVNGRGDAGHKFGTVFHASYVAPTEMDLYREFERIIGNALSS